MKRFLYVALGSTVSAVIGFFLSSGLSYIYEMKFAKSQAHMDAFAVLLVLAVLPIFAVVGGYLGNVLYRKNTNSHFQHKVNS